MVLLDHGVVDRKVYVWNLHFNKTKMQLRHIFEPFGPVELVQLPLNLEIRPFKSSRFIQFAQLEHAKATPNPQVVSLPVISQATYPTSILPSIVSSTASDLIG